MSLTNLTTINNNDNKKNEIIIKHFIKPKISEIIDYCNERKNEIEAEAFYDFYECKDWFVGKSKMKNWKAAVRNWERSDKKQKSAHKPYIINKQNKLDSQINEWNKAKELL